MKDLIKQQTNMIRKESGMVIKEGKIGTGEYANIYDMKKEMKEGKFDPKNPTIAVTGL